MSSCLRPNPILMNWVRAFVEAAFSGCGYIWNNADCSLRQGARPLKGTYKGKFSTYFWGFFGSMWAHKGPYGPGPDPWRAGIIQENQPFFLSNTFSPKIVVFDLQTTFFDGKTVFFRSLAEIRLRTLIKSPQQTSSRPISCKFRTTCTLP